MLFAKYQLKLVLLLNINPSMYNLQANKQLQKNMPYLGLCFFSLESTQRHMLKTLFPCHSTSSQNDSAPSLLLEPQPSAPTPGLLSFLDNHLNPHFYRPTYPRSFLKFLPCFPHDLGCTAESPWLLTQKEGSLSLKVRDRSKNCAFFHIH